MSKTECRFRCMVTITLFIVLSWLPLLMAIFNGKRLSVFDSIADEYSEWWRQFVIAIGIFVSGDCAD